MKNYLTQKMIRTVLERLKCFEKDLYSVFESYGYDFRENLGRRNALLSKAQEHEIAEILRTKFNSVIEDGRPGKPDVFIADIGKELECKLTSGHGKSKSYDLQTDWATLQKKGSLDYIYIITNADFDKFCVLLFDNLTCDDFFPPANGSRGKSRMNKKIAMKKAKALHGSYHVVNDKMIKSYQKRIEDVSRRRDDEITEKLAAMVNRNENVSRAEQIIKNIEERYEKKITMLEEKIQKWSDADPRYSIRLKECD
jgi:hypothetical protein